jgi:hypothetical protein
MPWVGAAIVVAGVLLAVFVNIWIGIGIVVILGSIAVVAYGMNTRPGGSFRIEAVAAPPDRVQAAARAPLDAHQRRDRTLGSVHTASMCRSRPCPRRRPHR